MKKLIPLALLFLVSANGGGCNESATTSNGIALAQARVQVGPSGMTIEQENVKRRVEEDNKPGTSKYLYVLSPYSGEVVIQSTVKGKVSSGGKRLEPGEAAANTSGGAFKTPQGWLTSEVMQPDGTYGSSGDYLYWWDVQGVYHQHYLTGGQIVHVASQPMSFGRVTMDVQSR